MAATLPATPNPPSAQFQLAVPSLLATVSPSLAALHATRARLLHPPHVHHPALAGTHCARCGYPLLASDGQTRSCRKKRTRRGASSVPRHVLRRSCASCGHDEDVLLPVVDAPTFPKVRDRVKRKSPATATSQPRGPSAAYPSPAHLSSPNPAPVPLIPRSSQAVASSSQSTPIPSRPGSAASSKSASSLTSLSAPPSGASQVQDQARTKARPKKKTGLQCMLARNRQRQEQEKKREGNSSQGLSAFLQGL